MEAAFNNLQKQGKNDVENLIKWLKDSKVIDQIKEQEEKARSFFNDVPDKTNVTLEKFKEVVKKLAAEFTKNFDGLSKQLAESGPKLLQSVLEGATSTGLGGLGSLGGALKDLVQKK